MRSLLPTGHSEEAVQNMMEDWLSQVKADEVIFMWALKASVNAYMMLQQRLNCSQTVLWDDI